MQHKHTAQGLASLGRGPDTELVHMTKGEVHGLQKLAMAHGGSLTINPQTGLPEAGFLSSILPMIIGAGLIAATGGAAAPAIMGMSAPAAIGLGVGGVQALRTGSLSKGLMAGLGAYGGAGLGAGLMGAGAEAAANQAVPALTSGADTAAVNKYATDFMAAKNAAGPFESMGQGLSGIGSPGGVAGITNAMGGGKGLAMAGLAAASPMLATTTDQPEIKPNTDMGQRYRFNSGMVAPTPNPDVPDYGDQGRDFGKEQQYYNPSYTPIDSAAAKTLYGYAAGGGISNLGDYSDGGRLLRGPGDGVSDSIPASIGRKQPARLADGEFVVPARIVSELGNGSTEAGARKLYAMLDRVQNARKKSTGKSSIAVNSKAANLLPA